MGVSKTIRIIGFLLFGAAGQALAAQQGRASTALNSYPVNEPGGQILSYRYQAGATDVRLQGTRRAPNARIRLKIGSRPGFVELDINRGLISGMEPARSFGKDFLTYVLWAVSVDGRAANLGEITFDGPNPVSINVTTPYQTFWLMVTAEPDYAVADPSPVVVLYSVDQNGADAPPEKRALKIDGSLSYYSHYSGYDTSPGKPESAPNELLQARKALELASKAGSSLSDRGKTVITEDGQIRKALTMARSFLDRAETAYKKDPKGTDVIQFARTAAQIAENGRALALGAVGDVAVRRLENELHAIQSELKESGGGKSNALSTSAAGSLYASSQLGVVPPAVAAKTLKSSPAEEEKKAGGITETVKKLAAQPITWFGVIGWAVVVLLLFRRPAV